MGGFFIFAFCLSTRVPKTEEKVFIHLCTNFAFLVNTIMKLFIYL
jgi:hypothetical protein